MKGILWKWTNYWNGWQPRWFILDNGVLSYYQSEDEVKQGCKGSVSLSACDISVHPTDNLRLDIVIPGEQHIYVRAASTLERQQWLVALGTQKAQGISSGAGNGKRVTSTSESNATPDAIKTKKSELRLYCDLLMQQVHSIKEAANGSSSSSSADPSRDPGPDIQKLDECTSLLSATCETFISTLEDCVKMTDAAAQVQAQSHHHLPIVPTTSNSTAGNSSSSYRLAATATNGNGTNGNPNATGSGKGRARGIAHANSN